MSGNETAHEIESSEEPSALQVTPSTKIPESTLTLPVSRIKKIIKLDAEHVSSTDSANYLIGKATELFVMRLTETASFVAKADNKKKIEYKHMHSAVTNNDNLVFLTDLVPKVVPFAELYKSGKITVGPGSVKKVNKELNIFTKRAKGDDKEEDNGDSNGNNEDIEMSTGEGTNDNTVDETIEEEDLSMNSGNTPSALKARMADEKAQGGDLNSESTPVKSKGKPGPKKKVFLTPILPKGQRTLPFKKAAMSSIINDPETPGEEEQQDVEIVSEEAVRVSNEPKKIGVTSLLSQDDDDVVMAD